MIFRELDCPMSLKFTAVQSTGVAQDAKEAPWAGSQNVIVGVLKAGPLTPATPTGGHYYILFITYSQRQTLKVSLLLIRAQDSRPREEWLVQRAVLERQEPMLRLTVGLIQTAENTDPAI